MTTFLEVNDALPVTQSVYRKFHSTESALLKVYLDLCLALGKGHIALLGLLDLSAAFDSVNHEILLKRLESSYGITGAPLNWMRFYITNREQSVNVCSAKSAKVRLNCGVLQGSVLGPLLFVLYTKDVINIIKRHGLINHSTTTMQMIRSCTSIACQKNLMHSPVLLVHVPKSSVHG